MDDSDSESFGFLGGSASSRNAALITKTAAAPRSTNRGSAGSLSVGEPAYVCIDSPGDTARIHAIGEGISHVLETLEFDGYLALETESVYGAAIAMPQIARSVRWNSTYVSLAVRSYLLLFLNFILQGSLISFVAEAEIMDLLAGKMHLCDYGAALETCPEGPHCQGPSGTRYTKTRLFSSFNQWSVRTFVRDMLVKMDPTKKDEIMQKIDPGEYGVENNGCRLICCFVFTMSITSELFKLIQLIHFLIYIPAKKESWISYVNYSKGDGSQKFLALNLCDFHVAGMPYAWKVINLFFVLMPKAFLWVMVLWEGFHFLMEEADTVDLVLGSMAMGFILNVDELLLETLGTKVTKHIMEDLSDLPCFRDPAEAVSDAIESDEEYLQAVIVPKPMGWLHQLGLGLPRRLLVVALLFWIGQWRYYHMNCQVGEDGSYVSKSMYHPKTISLDGNIVALMKMLVFEEVSQEDEPYWSPPDTEGSP